MKIWIALGALILILGIVTWNLNNEDTIKIGVILPLTGTGAHSGEAVQDGLRMAVDELNAWGGVGNKKIELIIADGKTDINASKKAFKRIEAEHEPLFYISVFSSISVALAPLAEENKVVLMGLVAVTPKLTRGKNWVFRYYAMAKNQVHPIMAILKRLNAGRLGILYLNDEYGTSIYQLLKEQYEAKGGSVTSVSFENNTLNYEPHVAQLLDREAIYVVGFAQHLKVAIKQIKKENYKGFIIGPAVIGTVKQATESSLTEGVYFAAPIIYNTNFRLANRVREKYEARYKKFFTHPAANGYDFLKLIASILEDKKLSRSNVKHLLEQGFTYPGIFGEIQVKPGEHDIGFPLHPAQIVKGKIDFL